MTVSLSPHARPCFEIQAGKTRDMGVVMLFSKTLPFPASASWRETKKKAEALLLIRIHLHYIFLRQPLPSLMLSNDYVFDLPVGAESILMPATSTSGILPHLPMQACSEGRQHASRSRAPTVREIAVVIKRPSLPPSAEKSLEILELVFPVADIFSTCINAFACIRAC